jgi:hypothetical protein
MTAVMPEPTSPAIQQGGPVEKHILSSTYHTRTALEADTHDEALQHLLVAKNDISKAIREVVKAHDEQVTMRVWDQTRLRLITEDVRPGEED